MVSGLNNSAADATRVRGKDLRLKNVRRGTAGRMREGGAGPAALLGEGGSRPGRRVRGRTLEPVWSTGSEKGDGRALSGRMGRLSRPSLLSNFRTTGALVKPRRDHEKSRCHWHLRNEITRLAPVNRCESVGNAAAMLP